MDHKAISARYMCGIAFKSPLYFFCKHSNDKIYHMIGATISTNKKEERI